jgi:protein-arginine kinase activator protein McsA
MICEKCQKNPAKVRILKAKGDSDEALSTRIEQHLCEDCARDYIQSDPQLRQGRWSKPTKHFVLEGSPNHKPLTGSQNRDR